MTRRRLLLVLLAVVVVAVGALAWLNLATHYTPAGQSPLTTLDVASLSSLKEDFNRASAESRMIVLLSPT
jgi:hypothetical protein